MEEKRETGCEAVLKLLASRILLLNGNQDFSKLCRKATVGGGPASDFKSFNDLQFSPSSSCENLKKKLTS